MAVKLQSPILCSKKRNQKIKIQRSENNPMGDKCAHCGKDIEVIDKTQHENYSEEKFRCGHSRKNLSVNLFESISVSDRITTVVKARTLAEIPVVLDLLDKQIVTSGSLSVTYDKSTNIVNAGTVNITNTYNFQKINLTIEDITLMIDSNNTYTPEEKVVMKDALTKITEINSLFYFIKSVFFFSHGTLTTTSYLTLQTWR